MINIHLEALQKLIDKYKESLSDAKDLYEYQKNIADQTKNITSLEKQLAAYEGDNSEENRARVQQLRKQLEDAQTQLKETEWDKYISETENFLDDMYEDYEETLNARLDDIDALMKDMIEELGEQGGIAKTVKKVAKDVGYTLTDSMKTIISSNNVAVDYDKNFDNNTSTTTRKAINTIKKYVKDIRDQSVKAATDESKVYKPKAYASGSKKILNDQWAWTQEDGTEIIFRKSDGAMLTPLSSGDMVFTNEMSNRLWEMARDGVSTNMPVVIPNTSTYASNDVDININVDKVVADNPEQFANQLISTLKNNQRAENIIQEMTLGQALGNGKLNKRKY